MYGQGSELSNSIGNRGHQSDQTSACIACWSLGRFVFAFVFEVVLVGSNICLFHEISRTPLNTLKNLVCD